MLPFNVYKIFYFCKHHIFLVYFFFKLPSAINQLSDFLLMPCPLSGLTKLLTTPAKVVFLLLKVPNLVLRSFAPSSPVAGSSHQQLPLNLDLPITLKKGKTSCTACPDLTLFHKISSLHPFACLFFLCPLFIYPSSIRKLQ